MNELLIKSRFIAPYKENNTQTNLLFCKRKSGVYLIKNKITGSVVYIGYSGTNLYKTIIRHFQNWDDDKQVRTTYKNRDKYAVRVVFTTPARAEKLERALIVKMKPKDNPDKLRGYEPTVSEERIYNAYEKYDPATKIEMEEAPF